MAVRIFVAGAAGCAFALGAASQGAETFQLAEAEAVVFGDDGSEWANDGECDDPRFIGDGMTSTPLMEADTFHDATDCSAAFEAGTLRLRTENDPPASAPDEVVEATGDIDFGDDSSQWANDGECDDPRFAGDGMTGTPLLDSDIARDATDCQAAFNDGSIHLRSGADEGDTAPSTPLPDGFALGDNSSRWARDGECDDPRFEGPGTAAKLVSADIGRDADDCQAAFEAGDAALTDDGAAMTIPARRPASSIDFGDNDGRWVNDAECDDPRFEGAGSASKLAAEDAGHDALDCRAAYENGRLRWVGD